MPWTIGRAALAALLLALAFSVAGIAGVFSAAALALLVVFAAVAARAPTLAMASGIWCLGLAPFSWGLETGDLPKLFADESLLLLYLAVLPALYVVTARSWRHGFTALYLCLGAFVSSAAVSFAAGGDLIAFRSFLETYVLGSLLLVLFLQEASNKSPDAVAKTVVWLTVVIAAISIIERIVQHNPFVEQFPDRFASAELLRLTEGVYRPYVSFFHPSEAGTFMALGVPFAVRAWRRRRSWFSFFGLSVLAAGLFVNATRGVWFGLIVAGLLALLTRRRARAWLAVTLPVAAIGGWIGYLAFATSPFLKRLMNPVDLIERFEYWEVGAKMLLAHPLIGVGPTRFKEAYLAYVEKFGTSANFDVTQVVTPDNLFLSTAAEQGLIGLAGLMVFLIFALVLLKKSRARLHRRGLTAEASLVRCSELALVVYVGAGCFADVEWFSKATKLLFILIGIGLAEGARHAVRTGNMGMCTPKADRAT